MECNHLEILYAGKGAYKNHTRYLGFEFLYIVTLKTQLS